MDLLGLADQLLELRFLLLFFPFEEIFDLEIPDSENSDLLPPVFLEAALGIGAEAVGTPREWSVWLVGRHATAHIIAGAVCTHLLCVPSRPEFDGHVRNPNRCPGARVEHCINRVSGQ